MNLETHRPIEHQRVIAFLKEAKEPPADADTPAIPDDVLDRLRGQYGRAPRRAIVEDKPSFWASMMELFISPQFAFAAALLLLCGVAAMMQRSPAPEEELMRGVETPTAAAVQAYWLQSDQAEPLPIGMMPKPIVLTARDPLPTKGSAVVFDPANNEARLIKDGTVTEKMPITDAAEWPSAYRQLKQRLMQK